MNTLQQAISDALNNSVGQFHYRFLSTFNWSRQIKVFDWFTKLPKTDQDKWLVDFSHGKDPDDGLIIRGGGLHDLKAFFHFRPRIIEELKKQDAPFVTDGTVLRFFEDFNFLHKQLLDLFKVTMQTLDAMYPGYDFVKKIPEDPNQALVIRLIKYPEGSKVHNGILAKAHYDQNFCSIHLHETQPGLFFGESAEIPFVSDLKKAALFFSSKAQVVTGGNIFYKAFEKDGQRKYEIDSFEGGLIKATKHVVLSKEATLGSERFSVVAFFHTTDSLPEPCLENVIL